MTTVTTGEARKKKVGLQASNCKPDQIGRLFAADARWRNEELSRWREYLLIERDGRTARLENLTRAAWRLVTSYGLLPADANGRPLALLREDGSYLIGVSQLSVLAGCSTQTIYRELREYVDQIAPMVVNDPNRSVFIWSRDPEGFVNGVQSEWLFRALKPAPAEVVAALGGPSHFEKVASRSEEVGGCDLLKMSPTLPPEGREGKGSVCSSRKITNPSLPTLPSEEGAKAPMGGVGKGEEAGEELPAGREALRVAILDTIGRSPRYEAEAKRAAKACPGRLVLGYTDLAVLDSILAKVVASGANHPELALCFRLGQGQHADLIRAHQKQQAQEQPRKAAMPQAVLEGMGLSSIRECPVVEPRSPETLLSTATGTWVATSLLDALEAFFRPSADEDAAEGVAKWLGEAGNLALDGCLVQIQDGPQLRSLEARLRKLLGEREEA